jgi:P27 family predicted phage terminase small subunit
LHEFTVFFFGLKSIWRHAKTNATKGKNFMGTRGPKPTPTALLKLRGSWRGELNRNEPKPPKKKRILPPKGIRARAKIVWNRIFPIVRNMQVMTVADVDALERYCETLIIWRDLRDFLDTNGTAMAIIENEHYEGTGRNRVLIPRRIVRFTKYPQAKQFLEFSAAITRYEESFGLNPSARSRLTIELPTNFDGKATTTDQNDETSMLKLS